AEPVVGATLGAVPAIGDYFMRIRDICDRYGVLLILDEVMCGMGRTGHLFACEADGIAPDILCIAKGLGGGYQPIGAMLCTGEIYDRIAEGSGFFQHGHTYLGHPVATAAGLAVVEELVGRDMPAEIRRKGADLETRLRATFGQSAHIGDIRGRGLFWGIELVSDRASKAPFAPDLNVAGRIKAAALAEGLICYPMQGTRDGVWGDHVLLAPPFIISDAQMDEVTDKLQRAIDTALNRAVP
ncbi:MAG: aminotransferase class III-fold pyridoxal phosphate-dependent enzyme, partial [Pseudomonadota bacterium]